MNPIDASKTGHPSYPLLTLLRGLLLGSRLSDAQLAASLSRELLFRRFCRLALSADIADATTLGRFRQQLVIWALWEKLPGEVNRQLEDQHIMREGRATIIDATPVEAAQSGTGVDGEAGWHLEQDSRGKLKCTMASACIRASMTISSGARKSTQSGGECSPPRRYGLARRRLMGVEKNLTLMID